MATASRRPVQCYTAGMQDSTPTRTSITQSPWYWLYLFCTAALIGLMLLSNKLNQRQLYFERNFQGRQRALEAQAGQQPTTALSTEGNTALSLQPLYLLLGGGLAVAWIVLWWRHFRYRPSKPPPAAPAPPATPATTTTAAPAASPATTASHPPPSEPARNQDSATGPLA